MSYDQYYCVNGTGVDEEDGVAEEDQKKALVIIYKKHSLRSLSLMTFRIVAE